MGFKMKSPFKKKDGIGKGFMNPPYKDTVKGTRPYAKRQGYHGYKDFTSVLASTDTKRKVMKDGRKTDVHGIKGGVGTWMPYSQRMKNKK
jgi:hypothetical protein